MDDAVPSGRHWLRLLIDPVFGTFLLGKFLFTAGQWIHNVGAAMLAYELTRSAQWVGAVTAAQFTPQLLLALWSGAIADRRDRRTLLLVGRMVCATGSGGLALWLWLGTPGIASVGVGPVVVAAAVVGVGMSISSPAMHALVPALARPDEIETAVTLNVLPVPLARAVGPVLASVAALSLGFHAAFAVAALCNLTFLATFHMLPGGVGRRSGSRRSGPSVSAFLRSDRAAVVLLGGVIALGIGTDPTITLAPSVSAALGHGTAMTGAIGTAFGIGAALGLLLLPVSRRLGGQLRAGGLGILLIAAGIAAVVPLHSVAAVLTGFGAAGAGFTVGLAGLSSALQRRTPDTVRGRVMAIWYLGLVGSRPFAASVNGLLAEHWSITAALCATCVLLVVVALAVVRA